MKYLATVFLAVALTTTGASAQVLFEPDLSGSTTPTGYTAVTAGGGTIAYSNNSMTVGDLATNGAQAYLTATLADPGVNTFTSQFTFTPNYHADQSTGSQTDITFFQLESANSNNPVLGLVFHPFGFGNNQTQIFIQRALGLREVTSPRVRLRVTTLRPSIF